MNIIQATAAAIETDQRMRRQGWHHTVFLDIPDRNTFSWYRLSTSKSDSEGAEIWQGDPQDILANDWLLEPNPWAIANEAHSERDMEAATRYLAGKECPKCTRALTDGYCDRCDIHVREDGSYDET